MADFSRQVERAMKDAAERAYAAKAQEVRARIDRLSRELKGQDLAVAKDRVQRAWRADGGSISDPELTRYATAFVNGARVDVSVTPIRW